jgi:nicotinamidase-related amidase
MTLLTSRLSHDDTVLVIVDVQERLAAAMSRKEAVVRQASLLAHAAAITGCPIVVTRQYPKGLGDTERPLAQRLDDLAAQGASVEVVDKVSFDCFAEPAFVEELERIGRSQVLIAGMESHICVVQTSLAALDRGFDVHVAADACCSRENPIHDLAIMRLSRAGAVVTTAESAAYELIGRAGTPEFKALLAVVKG